MSVGESRERARHNAAAGKMLVALLSSRGDSLLRDAAFLVWRASFGDALWQREADRLREQMAVAGTMLRMAEADALLAIGERRRMEAVAGTMLRVQEASRMELLRSAVRSFFGL